jgi:hypothetical protein
MHGFDGGGYHILASRRPIPARTGDQLAERMPEKARRDVVEWSPESTSAALLGAIVDSDFDPAGVLDSDPSVIVTDDHPYNEYCLLRRIWEWWTGTYTDVL